MQANMDEHEHKAMTAVRRCGGLYTVGLLLLLMAFFAVHQWKQTGFFTEQFGTAEMIALYAPIVISMAPPIQRAIQGRANPARLTEAISDLLLALGSLWLWHIFPFDFSRIANIFPARMSFAFGWLTDGVGKVVLVLQVALGFISTLSNVVTYLSERGSTRAE